MIALFLAIYKAEKEKIATLLTLDSTRTSVLYFALPNTVGIELGKVSVITYPPIPTTELFISVRIGGFFITRPRKKIPACAKAGEDGDIRR